MLNDNPVGRPSFCIYKFNGIIYTDVYYWLSTLAVFIDRLLQFRDKIIGFASNKNVLYVFPLTKALFSILIL